VAGFQDKVGFIWSVADLLRGDIKQHEYGSYMLPFIVLRRLDCVLEPTKQAVIDRAKALDGKVENVGPLLRQVAGVPFYNTSPLTFTTLLNDDKNIKANLLAYVRGFSAEAADVLERYKLRERIDHLARAGLLYQMVAKFADLDLHVDAVPNEAMGYIFEELLRRFYELQNETAGEHFTPREVIHLMTNILLAEDTKTLAGEAPVRTLYDPACGTGGMLAVASEHFHEFAVSDLARLEVYGQELNPDTWAVCRSDLLIKGGEADNIALGNSLTDDKFAGQRFDYCLANPPFGVAWGKYADPLVAEAEKDGWAGRFGAGLPRISDGSFLFLQHMLSKMKPVKVDAETGEYSGGTRLAIVFSGSPLFSGAAGSGESNIRKWIIENDWLEAVVGLPDQMFYNTGINTYFWVLTNRKRPERRGKVALIDVRGEATKMRKSLGNKRNYLTEETIADLTRLYVDAPDLDDTRVKMLPNTTFGFQRITVEQPLRRRWEVTDEALTAFGVSKAWVKWCHTSGEDRPPQEVYAALLGTRAESEADLLTLLARHDSDVPLNVRKELAKHAAVADPDAPVITDRKGQPLPDPDLRDYENVPLGEDPEDYLKREVHPYAPDAWIDHAKTKVGYEIPFTRQFYVYTPPRPVAELDAEIAEREARIRELLGGLA
jgi:type I restriction enzyme M protein